MEQCARYNILTHHQVNGKFARVFGTSASAPVVGSILTMVNDARLAIGKKPIGFINPSVRPLPLPTLSLVRLMCSR